MLLKVNSFRKKKKDFQWISLIQSLFKISLESYWPLWTIKNYESTLLWSKLWNAAWISEFNKRTWVFNLIMHITHPTLFRWYLFVFFIFLYYLKFLVFQISLLVLSFSFYTKNNLNYRSANWGVYNSPSLLTNTTWYPTKTDLTPFYITAIFMMRCNMDRHYEHTYTNTWHEHDSMVCGHIMCKKMTWDMQ